VLETVRLMTGQVSKIEDRDAEIQSTTSHRKKCKIASDAKLHRCGRLRGHTEGALWMIRKVTEGCNLEL
jgi:hypothetical protein